MNAESECSTLDKKTDFNFNLEISSAEQNWSSRGDLNSGSQRIKSVPLNKSYRRMQPLNWSLKTQSSATFPLIPKKWWILNYDVHTVMLQNPIWAMPLQLYVYKTMKSYETKYTEHTKKLNQFKRIVKDVKRIISSHTEKRTNKYKETV